MTPEQIALAGTEHAHQAAFFCWCNEQVRNGAYPQLKWIHAIPNGGKRGIVTAARLKAEGVKSGVSDVFLPYSRAPYHGLYIEMKKPGKGRLSDDQREFISAMHFAKYSAVVCMSWEEAVSAIVNYLGKPRQIQ